MFTQFSGYVNHGVSTLQLQKQFVMSVEPDEDEDEDFDEDLDEEEDDDLEEDL